MERTDTGCSDSSLSRMKLSDVLKYFIIAFSLEGFALQFYSFLFSIVMAIGALNCILYNLVVVAL